MRNPHWPASVAALFLAAMLIGCKDQQTSQAPVPLEVAKAPTSLEEAFAKAAEDAKAQAIEAAGYLRNDDFGRALFLLERLCARPELTADQRALATRSMLTAQQEVAKAASKGDKVLQEVIKYRAQTK